jgi:hypothetical protein
MIKNSVHKKAKRKKNTPSRGSTREEYCALIIDHSEIPATPVLLSGLYARWEP